MASLYQSQARHAEAESLSKRALAIREKSLGPEHPDVANSLNIIANIYLPQARYTEAEPLYKRALAIQEKTLGPEHQDVTKTLNNLVNLFASQQRYAEALPYVRRVIDSKMPARLTTIGTIFGAALEKLVDWNYALNTSLSVLQMTTSSSASDAVSKVAQRFDSGSGELAGLVRAVQDLDAQQARVDKALIDAVANPPSQRNSVLEDQWRQQSISLRKQVESTQFDIEKKFPNYVALTKPPPLSIIEIQALLDDDEAVIAISPEDDVIAAWAITKTGATMGGGSLRSAEFSKKIAKFRESLNSFERGKAEARAITVMAKERTEIRSFDLRLAYEIYSETLGRVAYAIADKKRLSIFAHGALTSIPFGLLVTSDPAGKSFKDVDWLIKSHSVTIIPSIYSLKTMRSLAGQSKAPRPIVAFADPIFSMTASRQDALQRGAMRSLTVFYKGTDLDLGGLAASLPSLPGTRREVEAIGNTLGARSSELVFGSEATETKVKQTKLDQYRVVYFATHGLVSGELEKFGKARAEPSLVLSIPDRPSELDDGLLSASEAALLKLDADWVVLSACNTASADGVGADALSGLARAFLYAGARSLIVSHWEIDDAITARLMSRVFEISSRNKRLTHGEVMQQATLELIASARNDDEAHPALWAPFVVVGEPGRLR